VGNDCQAIRWRLSSTSFSLRKILLVRGCAA
jgi:hypothetical protein